MVDVPRNYPNREVFDELMERNYPPDLTLELIEHKGIKRVSSLGRNIGDMLDNPDRTDQDLTHLVAQIASATDRIERRIAIEKGAEVTVDTPSFVLGGLTVAWAVISGQAAARRQHESHVERAAHQEWFNKVAENLFQANPDNVTFTKLATLFIEGYDPSQRALFDSKLTHPIYTAIKHLEERGLIDSEDANLRLYGDLDQ